MISGSGLIDTRREDFMTSVYRLAEQYIEICSLYNRVHEMCNNYRVNSHVEVAFTVNTSLADIELEREKSKREAILEGIQLQNFSNDYLETLAVYRKIAEKMPEYDRVLIHGSVVAVDGRGYLFTAKSGTGKSTHTRLWRELLGDRAVMVNDDKPLLHVAGNTVQAYGTPWDGKHHLSSNISAQLKAICILERAEENYVQCISKAEAFPILLQQVYRPADISALSKTLQLIDRMNVEFYRLKCNMDISAAELAYRTMK